jgi:hypothetical protein
MKRSLLLPMAAFLALLGGGPAEAYQNGAPTLKCYTCHTPTGDHASTLKVKGIPKEYKPGKTYRMSVAVKSDIRSLGDVKGGFVMRASAGELIASDPVNTQMSNGLLTHTIEGSALRAWKLTWKAPHDGDVEFTVMATAANGDFAPIGDAVLAEVFAAGARK